MLSLNADQTADLPFPVGCPVWYNGAAGDQNNIEQPLLKRGVVQVVSFDIATKSMLYSIGASLGGGITDDVPEGRLAFGASCPVSVTFDGGEAEGTILLSGPSEEDPGKIVYTVMLSSDGNCTLAEGIDGEMVSYRKEVVASEEALMAAAFAGGSIEKKASQPKKNEANNRVTPSPKLPASITCNATKSEDGKRDDLSMNKKRAREDSDSFSKESTLASSESKESIRMVMHIPDWMQPDLRLSKKLFYHLVGSRRDGRRGVADIGQESNCRILVKYDPKSKMNHPMSIHFLANSSTSAVRDLHDAREEVQKLLVQRIGPVDPGCAGRLFDGKVAHHASFLDKYASQLDEHDCFMEICAKKFTPVYICDPYVLVRGTTWQSVDLAVEIVKRAIWDHMAHCDCYLQQA